MFIEGLTQIELNSNRRKPYMYIAYYYEYIFNVTLPHIPTHEEKIINNFFAEIFYATNRLRLTRPTYPMTTLLRLIVFTFEFSPETTYIVRFTKGLRCAKRRRRYREDFEKCCAYIRNDGDRGGLFETIKRRKLKVSAGAIYEVGRLKPGSIYKTKAEMDEAVKNKTFHINKTMALKNGRLFFLCYE